MSNIFYDKNVLVAGSGVSGTGAKEALLKLGASVTIFCDGDRIDNKHYDFIVLSPSFEKDHYLYEFAKNRNIRIFGEYELGCMLNLAPLIAVTGTNGKTTVVRMISDIFSQSKKVVTCGNIGVSFSSCAVDSDYDVAITEVSSFQLEQTAYMHPKVAIITNITPDHLIRHKSMEEYARIKFSITTYQTSEDYLILPYEAKLYDLSLLKTNAKVAYVSAKQKVDGAYVIDDKIYFYGEEIASIPNAGYLKMPHNIENALFAVATGKIFGISNADIVSGLAYFSPSSHRLELVNVINGVSFFDDSKSTNLDSTLKALACMQGSVALIMGGSEKGLLYDELFENLDNVIKICVIGEISDVLINTAKRHNFFDIQKFENLETAVVDAFLNSPDNVLLSPGSASFGMFSSYIERGEKFKQIVMRIADGKI
ncbi:MAG: UDP-N-acetylmuramoyl-L-alanine--D-glutamate ligase [Clostridiales bacterium]|nr:UDP-N-acetylmuramoyl-L-alanine--D-glutamate ligase [Clostridiales bacterium]